MSAVRIWQSFAFAAAVVINTPAPSHANTIADAAAEINFTPCSLTGTGGNGNLHAECATWQRPLDPGQPDGEQIDLFVAKLKSTSTQPAADALTLVNGGPGGSSIDLLIQFSPALGAITRERDIVVLDQRGTGRSSRLTCDGIADSPENYDADQVTELIVACLAQLPYDPRYFTTSVAVDDLDALRSALGYDQLSIYGVSYGTRVALHYLRDYPSQTRAVVIDGVVPPSAVLGAQIAIHSQNALDQVVARCAADEACKQRFANVADSFDIVAQRLQQSVMPISLPHPVTGEQTALDLSYDHLATWVRFSLYAPETVALIPVTLHEAAHKNNYLPIASNALRMLHNVTTAMAYGMHNAVLCTEDAPFYSRQRINPADLEATYIGRDMYDTLNTLCAGWPEGLRDADIKTAIKSDVPTLILSGEHDPITPPAWGEAVLQGLGNARHIIAPGQGHGTIARGCMPRLIDEFIESADPQSLDTQCIEDLKPFPFFLNLLGPKP